MIDVVKARPGDVQVVVDLACESVSIDPLPVVIDRDAMAEKARYCMAPQNYLRLAKRDGEIVGAWAAEVHSSFWHERLVCSVLLHYARVPGAWAAMARDFYRWADSRKAIRVTVMELEPGADPRMVRLLKRIGFTRESTNLAYVRNLGRGDQQ